MRASITTLLVSSCCLLTGCGALRSIEQWKCDKLGMCHFGVTPSQANWESPIAPPASCNTPDCSPPAYSTPGNAMLNSTQPAELHPLPSDVQLMPPADCPDCVK